jgi:hypothetical protein
MRVLFDHSTPAPLRRYLLGHDVKEAVDQGWDQLSNGDLLAAAEREGFEVLITADKNIRYQQNLKDRTIAIIEIGTPQWPIVQLHTDKVFAALNAAKPGSYTQVDIPWKKKDREAE